MKIGGWLPSYRCLQRRWVVPDHKWNFGGLITADSLAYDTKARMLGIVNGTNALVDVLVFACTIIVVVMMHQEGIIVDRPVVQTSMTGNSLG